MARPPDAHDGDPGPGPRPDRSRDTDRSQDRATPPARASASPAKRLRTVWGALPPERRLAAFSALGLLVTLFLPWYQETVIARGVSANLSSVSASLTGWGAFSFVEAAVLLVAAGVLVLLFVRAEGAAFHVPGGDGGVVTAAGAWAGLLIVWRMFDKEGTTAHGLYETTSGIEWGIFIALGVAAVMTYAGTRIKLAHEPEPPLPGEPSAPRQRDRRPPARPAGTPGPAPVLATPGGGDPDSRPRRRIRPSSLAEPGPPEDQRPARAARAARGQADRTQVMPPGDRAAPASRRRATGGRPHRGLDFSELERIEFDEPPEAPRVQRGPDRPD